MKTKFNTLQQYDLVFIQNDYCSIYLYLSHLPIQLPTYLPEKNAGTIFIMSQLSLIGVFHCLLFIYNFLLFFLFKIINYSVQFSRSVLSDSLRPHESQHARPPYPSPTQIHVHRASDAIQPSHPLSSPSPPAPNPSQHQSLFQ